MQISQQVVEKGIAIAAAGGNVVSRTLPRANIKKIIIEEGTARTVSAGSVVANTAIKYIKVRINGKIVQDYDLGAEVDDKQAKGMALLRDLCAQKDGVALDDNRFEIRFPDAIPNVMEISLTIKFQGAETQGADAAGTVTAGDYDLIIETVPVAKKNPRIPYVTGQVLAHAATTGTFWEFVPEVPFKLRGILFNTNDSGTSATTTYDSFEIIDTKTGQTLFTGTGAQLRQKAKSRSKLALSTGMFLLSFPNGIVANTRRIQFKPAAATAGTAKYVEMLAIAY